MDISKIFSKIYENNTWDYGSGPGSLPAFTGDYRKVIEEVIKRNKIKTVLDYGCGDWQFSKLINWEQLIDNYQGVDVVESLINSHRNNYESAKIKFNVVNDAWDWPTVDLIICKDVLQHLPNEHIEEILKKMKMSAKYLLITNDVTNVKGKFVENLNCLPGKWRPLDLLKDPWNLKGTPLITWPVKNRVKQCLLISTDF